MTVVPYQKPGAPASASLSVEQCKSAAWAVEPGNAPGQPLRRWRGAGAINAFLAVALGLKLPLSLYRLPAVRWTQERAYDLVAANRHRLQRKGLATRHFELCAAPIPMIIQSDHLQLHKDDEPPSRCDVPGGMLAHKNKQGD